MKTKLIKLAVIVIVLLGLVGTITGMSIKIRNQTALIEQSQQVISAYAAEADSLESSCKMFKMDLTTMLQLNDSIMNKMYEQAKLLKIKDSHIQNLQYKLEQTEKVTQIIVKDTIFIKPEFQLDTCIYDKWSSLNINLKYPNFINVKTSFNNEEYVVIHWKKVPIKPRKCKIAEWFTKKRKEIIVDVISTNPYVTTQKQRFIEIID